MSPVKEYLKQCIEKSKLTGFVALCQGWDEAGERVVRGGNQGEVQVLPRPMARGLGPAPATADNAAQSSPPPQLHLQHLPRLHPSPPLPLQLLLPASLWSPAPVARPLSSLHPRAVPRLVRPQLRQGLRDQEGASREQ